MNEKSARKLQLSRRIDGMHPAAAWSIRVASIVFALIVGGLLLLALGYSPLKAYGTIIDGSLGSKTFVRQTIKIAIPLLGCALAIAPCFKMHFWNIGAEGQITAGAIGATFFALKFGKTMPQLPLLLIMAVAAILCGGLWALIPAFFKAKWNTNETLFTLMMNYIIIGVVKWLQGGPWEAPPSGSQMIAQFAGNAKLPSVLGVHCGWIIVLVLTVLMFIYMRYTKHGYEIAVIGDSSNTARYAGMNVGRIMMRTMFLSGSISGLVGFIIVSGANHTLYDGVAGGVGAGDEAVGVGGQDGPFPGLVDKAQAIGDRPILGGICGALPYGGQPLVEGQHPADEAVALGPQAVGGGDGSAEVLRPVPVEDGLAVPVHVSPAQPGGGGVAGGQPLSHGVQGDKLGAHGLPCGVVQRPAGAGGQADKAVVEVAVGVGLPVLRLDQQGLAPAGEGGIVSVVVHEAQGQAGLLLPAHHGLALAEGAGKVVRKGDGGLAVGGNIAPLSPLADGGQALGKELGGLVLGGDGLGIGHGPPLGLRRLLRLARGGLDGGGHSPRHQRQGQAQRQDASARARHGSFPPLCAGRI